MKFLILEMSTSNHLCLIKNWRKCLRSKGVEASVAINKDINSEGYKLGDELECVKSSLFGFIRFLISLRKQKVTDIIFTTVQTNLFFFLFLFMLTPRIKKVVTIHNANTWLRSRPNSTVKGWVKFLIRRFILSKTNCVVVCSENIKSFLEKDKGCRKRVIVMPFMLTYDSYNPGGEINGKFTICIPGVVSESRKNYTKYLDILIDNPRMFRLVLLGRFKYESVSENFKRKLTFARSKGAEIILFSEFISLQEYDFQLSQCDLISADIVVNYTGTEDYEEVYGVSKDSGVSYNMISNRKPGLFNSGFKNLISLNSSTMYYDSKEDLEQIILSLKENGALLADLKVEANKNSIRYDALDDDNYYFTLAMNELIK